MFMTIYMLKTTLGFYYSNPFNFISLKKSFFNLNYSLFAIYIQNEL